MKTQTNLAALLLVAGGLALTPSPAAAGGNPCGASNAASHRAGADRFAERSLNPCSAKKANPCAAKAANPCAAKVANPCAANPCAAKAAANPCAANPCAANPCAAKKTQQRPN